MCEKAHKNYCFGNVNEGIDYQKVLDFYTMLDQHSQKCKDCWCQRLCETCYVKIGNKDKISKVRFDESCARNLKSAENRLRHFCQILEENPSAFA